MMEPLGHFLEVSNGAPGTPSRLTVYAYPKYVLAEGAFVPSNPHITSTSGTTFDFYAEGAVHEIGIEKSGRIHLIHKYGDKNHIIVMRLAALCRRAAARTILLEPQSVEPTVAGNTVLWENYFPGIDLGVEYSHDQVRTILHISPEGKSLLLAERKPDSALSAFWVLDDSLSGMQRKGWSFVDGGREKVRFSPPTLTGHVAKPHEKPHDKPRLDFQDTSFEEIIPWDLLEMSGPSRATRANATVTYQEGVDEYSGCSSNTIWHNDETVYDSDLSVASMGLEHNHGLLKWNNIPALGTVTSASTSLLCIDAGSPAGDLVVAVRPIMRAWNAAQANWLIYATGSSWTTAGTGVDTDVGAESFYSSAAFAPVYGERSVLTFNAAGISHVDARWQNQTNYGIILRAETTDVAVERTVAFAPIAAAEAAERPILSLDYTSARRRNCLGIKVRP